MMPENLSRMMGRGRLKVTEAPMTVMKQTLPTT